MITLVMVLTVLLIAAAATAFFFYKELMKKFKILRKRLWERRNIEYISLSSEKFGQEPGMRNIRARSVDDNPFVLTVYLLFKDKCADPYLLVQSDYHREVVFSTYVGNQPITLALEATASALRSDGPIELKVTFTTEDQKLTPLASAPPHWFQLEPLAGLFYWIGEKVLKLI